MNHLEDSLQMACVTWFRLQYPNLLLICVPNGGKRNAREAARFKRMGVTPGVADLFLPKSKRGFELIGNSMVNNHIHGLWIELKVGKGKQSVHQMDFEEYVIAAGYSYKIARTVDEFMKVVNEYLNE